MAIIDVDNIGVDGADALVKGTGPFMAPEILRDEKLPSTVSDLHSLAVLLFYLFVHGHPLLGVRADSAYAWDDGAHISETELLVHNFGLKPLFVFDPDDGRTRGHRVTLWPPGGPSTRSSSAGCSRVPSRPDCTTPPCRGG